MYTVYVRVNDYGSKLSYEVYSVVVKEPYYIGSSFQMIGSGWADTVQDLCSRLNEVANEVKASKIIYKIYFWKNGSIVAGSDRIYVNMSYANPFADDAAFEDKIRQHLVTWAADDLESESLLKNLLLGDKNG